MAPVTGGGFVKIHVWPPSLDLAVSALLGLLGSKSPPPTTPCHGSRKSTVKAPALGELTSGVSYAIHVFLPPCVVTQVPLDANENSPGNAGGILLLISCQVIPSVVRRSGNTPFTESLCAMPRSGVQNAKPS